MTIQDVARRARVSTATVSRTINSPERVSPATALLVQQAMRDLAFIPNRNAQALGTGRSKLFGLIISDITNPFFPEIVRAFESIAVDHGQEVVIANTDYDPLRMDHSVNRFLQRKVDGVAILTSEMDQALIGSLTRHNVPLVFLDIGEPAAGISTIRVDYAGGIDLAVQHLVQLGHRDLAFLSGPLRLPSAKLRCDAFCKSLTRFNLPHRAAWIEEADHRIEGGAQAMKRMLLSHPPPTAVFGSNDLTAIGAIAALHQHGLRVPEDISVIGFDDIQLCTFTQPSLTTIHVPRVQIAQLAFRALFDPHAGRKLQVRKGTTDYVEPSLVLRRSTAPPPGVPSTSGQGHPPGPLAMRGR